MTSGESGLAEVAEDFQGSLEFLTNNDRFAINNFTIIARENTEDAQDICDVLIEHIGKARPDHKLPALYVLDSIAKNIGSPYTLYLGHRLYSTFMQAYSSVDRLTRKKLDEMLKTWKSPVPGSTDTRPVFPVEITKKIENALLQVKTRTIQLEQQQQRAQQELFQRRVTNTTPSAQWRNTPTPPQNGARYPPPPVSQAYGQLNGHPLNTFHQHQQPPNYPPSQVYPQYQAQPQLPPQYPVQASSQTLDSLHRDIEELIRNAKDDYVRNMNDMNLQTKLKALVDLQQVLREQQLPPAAIQAVRDQVQALQITQVQRPPSQAQTPVPAQAPLQTLVTLPPPVSYSAPVLEQRPPPPTQPVSQTPSTSQLASLLASVQRNLQPQPSAQQPVQQIPTPQSSLQAFSASENPLFAQLRAAGLLNSATPSTDANSAPPTAAVQAPSTQQQPINLSDLLRSVVNKPSLPPTAINIERVELISASLKIPRPHLLSRLYEAKPNQCRTCGKRFSATEEGRAEKARHLDWHFHTNQRLAESTQRGLSRSWYVGEMEWIKFRDEGDVINDGSNPGGKDGQTSLVDGSRKDDPKSKFIPVPSDNALASQPCPICQEKFDVSRNEELQDFVWMDAIKIGNRVYHASCYADLKNDGANTPARTATPDSALGKRKAEGVSYNPSPAKALKGSSE